MKYYPVIIPTLNRYEHFKECVESLAACTHADKTELVIGLDYPPIEKYIDGWNKIKNYIPSIKGFKKVTVFEHKTNLGPFKNADYLINYCFVNYEAYIYTEDDNIFSPCFLDYINNGLEKYKNDKSVIAISGYMNPIKWTSTSNSNIIRMQDYMAWGVGAWKRTEEELEKFMPEHYMRYVCSHRKQLYRMRNNLRDLYQLIFWTKNNPALDIKCDFTKACYCIINNKYVINPKISLVRNMGYDGSGVNCGLLQNNYLSSQEISDQNKFEIIENSTDNEMSELRHEWEMWKSKDFSKEQKEEVLYYFRIYLILGYTIGNIYIKLSKVIFQCLRKVYRIIKRSILICKMF